MSKTSCYPHQSNSLVRVFWRYLFFPWRDFYLITLSDKRDVCTHVISPHKYIILIQSLESKLIWVVIGGNICEITRKTGEYYLVFSGRHWRMCGRRCEQFWQTGGPGLTNHQTRNILSRAQSRAPPSPPSPSPTLPLQHIGCVKPFEHGAAVMPVISNNVNLVKESAVSSRTVLSGSHRLFAYDPSGRLEKTFQTVEVHRRFISTTGQFRQN